MSRHGTPLDASHLAPRLKRLLKKAKLPEHVFHDLRHSAASFLLAQGVPERQVMEILGHSDIRMTQRYLHLLPTMRQAAADAMDQRLASRG